MPDPVPLKTAPPAQAVPEPPPPPEVTFNSIVERARKAALKAVDSWTSHPVSLLLVPLGLILALWYHEKTLPRDYVGISLIYLVAATVVIGTTVFLRSRMSAQGADGFFVFRVFLIAVAEIMAAALAFPWLQEVNGTVIALMMVVAASIILTGYWILLEYVLDKGNWSARWLGLPILFVIGLAMPLGVEVLPGIELAAKKSGAIANVRASVNSVETALARAEKAQAELRSAQALAQSAAATFVKIINGEERVPETTALDDRNDERRKGPLSGQLRATLGKINTAEEALGKALKADAQALSDLRANLKQLVAVLTNLNPEDKSAKPEELLTRLIGIQASANQLIGQANATANGLRGTFTGLAEPMATELAKTTNSASRIGIIHAHIASISGVEKGMVPVLQAIADIPVVSERPRAKGTLEVLLDFNQISQTSGMVGDVSRILLFAWFPALVFIIAVLLRATGTMPLPVKLVLVSALVGGVIYLSWPALKQINWPNLFTLNSSSQ